MNKPRLRRLEWVYGPGPLYFVTACTYARSRWLDCPEIHRRFVDFGLKGIERGPPLGRYVIMPDHIHLFVTFPPDAVMLSGWMKSLKNSLSSVLRALGKAAPHWQDGFFDHVMRSAESYEEKWQYVRLNPVRAGLVAQPEDWPYQGEIRHLEFR